MFTAEQVLDNNLTPEQKYNLNKVYTALYRANNPLLKSDIATILGGKSERAARDYVSAIKKVKPIISYNALKGFKLAKTADDVPENERSLFEDLSRVKELLFNCLPRLEFENQNGIDYKGLKTQIFTFLNALNEPKIAQYIISNKEE